MGPPTTLTSEEKPQLAEWLKALPKRGFPQKKKIYLLNTIQEIIKSQQRIQKLNDNRPGQK